ncbi:uncharacterized protein LOC129783983 [Falco peregrinus]|uniref:uncharacterized protein LOC129783983 n=1 Tax=Falco peregrinus TaxID=8954 RepID=UPI00247889A3|nr:uncharacterized protein LOC129783983 [Falco peregrinus]
MCREEKDACRRVNHVLLPHGSRRGIKAPAAHGAAQPAPAAPRPPAPAMSAHPRRLPLLLLLLLPPLLAALCRAAPLAGELRCRCLRTVSQVIPPRRLARVQLLAEGPHCAVPEVIATTKQGQTLCLDPAAPWVKLILTRIHHSSHNQLFYAFCFLYLIFSLSVWFNCRHYKLPFPFLTERMLAAELRCHCIQTVTGLMLPKHLANVEIIPKGPHCATVEIIATLKNSQQICLDPQAKWVKMLINKILHR